MLIVKGVFHVVYRQTSRCCYTLTDPSITMFGIYVDESGVLRG